MENAKICQFVFSFTADSMSLSSPPGTHSPQDFERDSQVPKEVISLSEHLQNLIMGRIAQAKTVSRTRKIVIYVCAADSQGKHHITKKNVYF